jgi:hypothetical protein
VLAATPSDDEDPHPNAPRIRTECFITASS